MQVNEYQKAAMATLNPALDKKDVLINSVMGLCGESGEAIDIVKKWLMQGHELDKEHLVRELGDVAWYLAEAATALDIPLEAVFQGNLDKLRQRFPAKLHHQIGLLGAVGILGDAHSVQFETVGVVERLLVGDLAIEVLLVVVNGIEQFLHSDIKSVEFPALERPCKKYAR